MARKRKALPKSQPTATSNNTRIRRRKIRRAPKRRSQTMGARSSSWSVYLIISTQLPKTYVGVTTDFSRRLKQHNGELRGGAKASSAGRPWTCACIIEGFKDQSEACMLEAKWKSFSQKLPRKKDAEGPWIEAGESAGSLHLLKHRKAALNKVKVSVDCSHLNIQWQQDPS